MDTDFHPYKLGNLAETLTAVYGEIEAEYQCNQLITNLEVFRSRTNDTDERVVLADCMDMLQATQRKLKNVKRALYLLLGSADFKLAMQDGFEVDPFYYKVSPKGLIVVVRGTVPGYRRFTIGSFDKPGVYGVL